MGMAASQARLLSITARLSDNENCGQSVSYAKQRLADQTQQITKEYNEALDATKLTVLTGFNGAEANYTDISYSLMTGPQMAESTRHYVVTDTQGKVLVSEQIANAYEACRGNYNQFLANLGYSQADIAVQDNSTDETAKRNALVKIHEAWDKYFETVGIDFMIDVEHADSNSFNFAWFETIAQGKDVKNPDDNIPENYHIGDGYVATPRVARDTDGNIKFTPTTDVDGNVIGRTVEFEKDGSGNIIFDPINYEGTTQESRDLYDYAMALSEAYLRVGDQFKQQYDMSSTKSAADSNNDNMLKYYKNIFNKIQASGCFTYTNDLAKVNQKDSAVNYVYTSEGTGTKGNVQKNPLKDNYTFEAALRDGTLRLEYYSTTSKSFETTTISDDTCIQEVPDERAIAKAESKYTQDMADLENKDNKLDLELKKLDTEHSALQTEYDALKSVVDKNVESSFKIFS